MPMNSQRLVMQAVMHGYNDRVMKVAVDCWTGPLTIDGNNGP